MEKNVKKKCVCACIKLNHFAVYQRLTEHHKQLHLKLFFFFLNENLKKNRISDCNEICEGTQSNSHVVVLLNIA